MKLSKRLQMNADLVPIMTSVADIGCDHGYVSIYLAQKKQCKKVIALDVNKGPLVIAKRNIARQGLSDAIECRLSNGLQKIQPGEVDTILIAGMGGMLVCKILEEHPQVLSHIHTLVLQPQSDYKEVRMKIHQLGFRMEEEQVCMEEGKYYFALRAVRGGDVPYTEEEYCYGKITAERQDECLKQYLLRKETKIRQLYTDLNDATSPCAQARSLELLHILGLIEKTLAGFD